MAGTEGPSRHGISSDALSRLPPVRVQADIRKQFRGGSRLSGIALNLMVEPKLVVAVLRESGDLESPLSDAEVGEIAARRLAGESHAAIARAMGRYVSTVRRAQADA